MSMVLLGLVSLGGPVTATAQVLFGPQRIVQQTDADVTQSEYQAVYARGPGRRRGPGRPLGFCR